MHAFSDYLTPDSVKVYDTLSSQKKAFEVLAELLTPEGEVPTQQIFDALIKREKLGSTAIGHGIAIPHARVDELPTPKLAVMKTPGIDFHANDGELVNMLFGVVVPTEAANEHLQLLADVSTFLKQPDNLSLLRAAETDQALCDVLFHNR